MSEKLPPKPGSFGAWMACCRPKTWGIAIAPVAVGLALTAAVTNTIDFAVACATMLLSILMQAISNMENDAGYTKRKAERSNRKGLPRATANGWLTVSAVERAIWFLGVVVLLDTAYLIYSGGWVMIAISVSSVLCAYCYMGGPKPIAYTPFGEAVVFLFFGLVAVCGTYYLQTGTVDTLSILTASALGSIAAGVLAVNNYRDLEHDASIGRRTLAVVLGSSGMLATFKAMLLVPYALIGIVIALDNHLWPMAVVLACAPAAVRLCRELAAKSGNELNAVLFGTVNLELQFSALLTIGALAAFALHF